jgi:hypothetical protein
MIGADLVHDCESKEPAGKISAKVAYRARELGVVVFYVGQRSNVLELYPADHAEPGRGAGHRFSIRPSRRQYRLPDQRLAGYGG